MAADAEYDGSGWSECPEKHFMTVAVIYGERYGRL